MEASMGRIGRTYARPAAQAWPQRHAPVVAPGTHAAVVSAMRHNVTGAIIAAMCALGFAGWLVSFWPLF
jgi:hypothetical protein